MITGNRETTCRIALTMRVCRRGRRRLGSCRWIFHVLGIAENRIEDFRFHDLRHTWASWHVQSGTSLQELMELGGWRSYEMVLRYAHLAPEKLSSVASRIERQPEGASLKVAPRVKNVAENATFALRLIN
jgi:integrase